MTVAYLMAYIAIGLLGATWALQACWAETRPGRRALYSAVMVVNVLLPSRAAAVLLLGVLPQ